MKRNRQKQRLAKKNNHVEPTKREPKPALQKNDSSDEDDEEIPEDEAFNSDDERKYGALFQKDVAGKNAKDDDDSDRSEEDDSDSDGDVDDEEEDDGDGDDDGGQYMLDLLNRLDANKHEKQPSDSAAETMARHVPESQFASSVVPTTGLTLDALLQGLESTKGFFGKDGLQSTMKDLITASTSGINTTSAPLPKITTDRMQRKLQYEHEQTNLSMWMEAVQEHRTAETLDFTQKERLADATREKMIEKFEPTTDFEKELFAAIQQQQEETDNALLDDPDGDDLGAHEMSLEEFKHRRAQLAKMRALLFYHEVKRHHINKIKSKTYRRIRKKQRQRLKESEVEQDPDLAAELQEKEEVERLKERMTLAHKNTSRWAKRVLKRGKNVDVNTRRALSAQLHRGDELRKKMTSVRGQGDAEDDDDDDDPNSLIESARQVLADTERDDQEAKGIFKLSFMQRGIEKQRERAREEARQLLMELQANAEAERDDDDDDVDSNVAKDDKQRTGVREDSDQGMPVTKKKKKAASDKDMKLILTDGKLVASSLEFGKASSQIAVSGNIEIDLGSSGTSVLDQSKVVADQCGQQKSLAISVTEKDEAIASDKSASSSQPVSSKKRKTQTPKATSDPENDNNESNPWIKAALDQEKPKPAGKPKSKALKTGLVDVEGAANLVITESNRNNGRNDSQSMKEKPNNHATSSAEKKILSMTQIELVRHAFYSDSPKEVDEEFAKEKQAMIERDDPSNKKKKEDALPKAAAGWGSWAGEGAPAAKPPRGKLPKHLQPPEKKPLPKRKRQDDKKPNVIINEKRIKKTANNFQIANIPYPFTSKEEYERAMTGGIGREWNATSGFKNLTRPEILTRSGKIIQPISKRAKQARPAAKF